mmetsp:Transcript_65078/g.121272  ORF Transcript_65078/g.121272 Transcript_65078/m.121272 type:complete len:399 (-) Transcript_65078:27-1223(-)
MLLHIQRPDLLQQGSQLFHRLLQGLEGSGGGTPRFKAASEAVVFQQPDAPSKHQAHHDLARAAVHTTAAFSALDIILFVLCLVAFLLLAMLSWRYYRVQHSQHAKPYTDTVHDFGAATGPARETTIVRRLPPTASKGSRNEDNAGHQSILWQGSEPPPIHPQFIMPKTEARFELPFDDLQYVMGGVWRGDSHVTHPIGIFQPGPRRNKLLQCNVYLEEYRARRLTVAGVLSPEDRPELTLVSARAGGATKDEEMSMSEEESERLFHVYGQGMSKRYGLLHIDDDGAGLFCLGALVMALDVTGYTPDGTPVQFTASSPAGQPLGIAGWRVVAGPEGQAMQPASLYVHVKPAVDALLVLACVLAKLLMDPKMIEEGSAQLSSLADSISLQAQGIDEARWR